MPTNAAFGETRLAAAEGRISLSRPGMGWLRWAVHREQAPKAMHTHGRTATLYASAGAAMMLRAEAPLPLIWSLPTPYLALVAVTWQGIYWAAANALPLSIGLGLAVLLFAFYTVSVAFPNRLRPATVLWLLPHPRHLLAASAYRDYARRWAQGDALEQLVLLLAPTEGLLTPDSLLTALCGQGALCDEEGLRLALESLARRGLLVREDGAWRLAQPLLLPVLRREQGREAPAHLARRTREEHPLSIAARRFFEQAGCALNSLPAAPLHRCELPPDLARRVPPPVYIQVLPRTEMNGTQVRAVHEQMKRVDAQATHVFVVTDSRPADDGWAQIGTLRMEGFTILPIESALIYEGLGGRRADELLRAEVEERLGAHYDPYNVRDPVAGVFSFFGRDALIETLLRRITEGRPVGVFGLRKMGKSSLLWALRDRAPFPVAVVSLQTTEETARELYMRILRYWAQWLRAHWEWNWQPPDLPTQDPTGAFVSATLDLLDRLAGERGNVRLGVFLDEVEVIVPHADGSGPDLGRYLTFLRALRGLVDEDGRLSLLVACLNPSISRISAWQGVQNPAFELFQEVYLPPLAQDDSAQMVRSLGRQVGLVYTDEGVAQIVALGGGHPFLTRQFCSLLLQRREYRPGQVEAAEIAAGIERFIYDEQTVTHLDALIWQDAGNVALWGAEQAALNQSLLQELARADGPLPEAHLLDAPDADSRRTALINLERFHFIHQPEPGAWALRYGLLRIWLRRRKLGLE